MPEQIMLPEQQKATSQATVVEQSRAVAEVAAAVEVAQRFPRDMSAAVAEIRQSCQQRSLADRAFYSLPRAGGRVEGSTVHLAKEMARCFRNIDFGVRETRRDDAAGESELLAWAWDQENNVRQSRSFIVPHARMARQQRQALTDLADIANNNNSVAARALRECILSLLPVWFRQEAETVAAATLAGDANGKTLDQQIADAIAYFGSKHNVTREQLEERLSRKTKQWTTGDVAVLRVVLSEIERGEKSVDDEFPQQALQVTEPAPEEVQA